jgi:cytochrome c oxidase assembly factor CtaG
VRHALDFLTKWTFDPLPGVLLVASAALYLGAVRSLQQRQPDIPWPRWCTVSFLSGLALTWLVVLGPFGAYDDVFFWSHMVQHIVLMMVAAPLLLLGSPILLLLRVTSRRFRHAYLVPVLRSRIVVGLTHPVVSWLVFAGVLVGTHFSPFFNYSLSHPLVHEYVEHPLYLGAALLYYYPLIGHNSVPRRVSPSVRVISLFTMMIPETMTGFFIYASNYLLYPFYSHVSRPFGPNPLKDQQFAGALMWGGSMLIDSVWVSLAVLEWLHSEERRSHRVDLETLAMPTRPIQAPQ